MPVNSTRARSTSLNPFTLVYQAILDTARQSSKMMELITPSNVMDQSDPAWKSFLDTAGPSDFPMLVLLQSSFVLSPFGSNSKISSMNQNYELIMTTDTLNVWDPNDLKFAMFNALGAKGTDLGMPGLVREWEITDSRDSIVDRSDWKYGSDRWQSTMTIVVRMYRSRAELRA